MAKNPTRKFLITYRCGCRINKLLSNREAHGRWLCPRHQKPVELKEEAKQGKDGFEIVHGVERPQREYGELIRVSPLHKMRAGSLAAKRNKQIPRLIEELIDQEFMKEFNDE